MKSGFTLIELLVGMAVSLIVFVAAISFYTYLVRLNSAQGRAESLSQTQNDLAQDLVNAIRWGPFDSSIYTLSGGRIYKNGQPLTPANLQVTAFSFTNYSATPATVSLKIQITIKDPLTNHQVSLDTIVSQRQSTLTL